ncbi:Fe(3+) ABC transporter substrate-binding protein [Echinimonas agarilytica]|uniref:Fe(3+) ABC transporter substrate-binding protein n=1 Tax=Echinimonas agarilytica TaxID=1215918 RepID=A0AA41W3D1_9GAMM|nr:Fe(3+) ABC transporter substrate-binding protein [Echinimonas agarilytica]MCM2678107.1 Fe(3+) ABC transporter substrate-binding protein [Echinimonas agarilytica]
MKIKLPQLFALMMCSVIGSSAMADEVNVYSSRKEALIKPLLDQFTQQTGIEVNLITGKDDALISRLKKEGSKSPADVLITADVGRLYRAKEQLLLQSHGSEFVSNVVPAKYRDIDGQWLGLTMRARPMFYVKGKVDPAELSTYENLADAKWKGQICIRSSSNIYNQSLIASMLAAEGADKTAQFAQGLVANMARSPVGGDTDQLRAAAAGVCNIAVANTYYFGRLSNSDKAADQSVVQALGVFWPNQADRGTHVNISGIAITRSARHKTQAQQLIEFMLKPESQSWYSEVNNEYPVIESAKPSDTLQSWGRFKADAVALSSLGEYNQQAVRLMDKAGWK